MTTAYSQLSAKRKLVVDLLVKEYPVLALDGRITFKDLQAFWDKIRGQRDHGGPKIGYPLWITIEKQWKTNKRGVYSIPVPDSNENLTPLEEECTIIDDVEYSVEEFEATILAAGIKPKTKKG